MSPEQPSNVIDIQEARQEVSPKVTWRCVLPEDFLKLKQLNVKALQTVAMAFGQSSKKRLEWSDTEWQQYIASNAILVGVNTEGDFVAMAGAEDKGEGVWQLHSVFLDSEAVRRGNDDAREKTERPRISDQLIVALLQEIEKRGAVRVDLKVNEKMTKAVELYERLGFTVTGELRDDASADGKLYPKLAMSKDLTRKEGKTIEEEPLPLAA